MRWRVCYKRAIQEDGSLLFPERLSMEFLADARRSMGTWLFANQYLNEILPPGEQPFKQEWIQYGKSMPDQVHTFAFIDPALSEQEGSDYTGVVVVSVDKDQNWYIRAAQRYRINPTQLVDLCFRICAEFKPMCLGIEEVAFQKALLYMLDEEMKRRSTIIPVKGINPGTDKSKEMRIMGLVPHFEWGRVYFMKPFPDLEMELTQFPRGKHDDLADALASIYTVVYYPAKDRPKTLQPHPGQRDYESKHIKKLLDPKRRRQEQDE